MSEAARVLGVAQRCLLEMLEAGEVEGERDPQTSRWKISKHALHELSPEPPPVDEPSEDLYEGYEDPPAETLRELIEELDNLQRELGRLKDRLTLAQRAENVARQEERRLLLAELEQERERLLEDRRRERKRADGLQDEANRLREELEAERGRGSLKRLFGG